MNGTEELLSVARFGDVVVVTPQRDLRELEFQQIQEEFLSLIDNPAVCQVVVDFGRTDSLGSTAIGMLVRLGTAIRQRQGKLAFCHLSQHEREILEVVGLARLWPILPTRREAIRVVG